MEIATMFWTLVGIIVCLLLFGLLFVIIFYKTVKYQSDRILANSLGEAKILEGADKTDAYLYSGMPETDEVLAKREENQQKATLIKLRKEGKALDKELEKIQKTYG